MYVCVYCTVYMSVCMYVQMKEVKSQSELKPNQSRVESNQGYLFTINGMNDR